MILVTGARGVVGQPMIERLSTENIQFRAVTRSVPRVGTQIKWNLDEKPSDDVLSQIKSTQTLIHCAPIWFLPKHLKTLHELGVKRMVVFSSTSVLSKVASNNVQEQSLVEQLSNSEHQIGSFCQAKGIALTILRPSMIYGYGRDQNISRIAGFIKRFGFFVLVGKASGLRQPVHADDLVNACLLIIDAPSTYGNTYNLAGADTMTYRSMVEKIFQGLDRTPRILSVPLFLFRPALRLAAMMSRFSYTPEMANRMMQNLNYDFSDASRDFDYQPAAFLSNAQQDLV